MPLPPSFQPIDEADWNLRHARYLLGRAAFGGPRDLAREWWFLGSQAATERACSGCFLKEPQKSSDFLVADPLAEAQRYATNSNDNDEEAQRRQVEDLMRRRLHSIQDPWLRRLHGPEAPREKLVLFWHGFFTSSFSKVDNRPLMLAQNARLRRSAYGDYREFILSMITDPAMIYYLDIVSNTRRNPNENFARELLELFTLGIGNYDDTDIKRLAKVFVNLKIQKPTDDLQGEVDVAIQLQQSAGFTDRMKQIRREVSWIFLHRNFGLHLAKHLLKFYVTETPSESKVIEFRDVLRQQEWHIGKSLNILFRSKYFYHADHWGLQIKSPVQFFLQALIDLEIKEVPTLLAKRYLPDLGQSLFEPPNVAGWPGGRHWIHSTTLANRYALIEELIPLRGRNGTLETDLNSLPLLGKDGLDTLCERFLLHPLPKEKRLLLLQKLKSSPPSSPLVLLQLILQSPEYQLC